MSLTLIFKKLQNTKSRAFKSPDQKDVTRVVPFLKLRHNFVKVKQMTLYQDFKTVNKKSAKLLLVS